MAEEEADCLLFFLAGGWVSLANKNALECSQARERRLSVDWKKIKAEYIAGGTSYRKLAEKYGVSFSTLRKVAAKEQWTDLRNKTRAKVDTKLTDSISDKEVTKAKKIINVADKLLDKIVEVMDVVTDTQGIRHLASALKDIKDIKGVKSDRDIREQEARIAKLQKDAEKQDDTTNEIEIVFNAGSEAWNE